MLFMDSNYNTLINRTLSTFEFFTHLEGRYRVTTDYSGHAVDPLWARTQDKSMTNHPALYAPYYDGTGA